MPPSVVHPYFIVRVSQLMEHKIVAAVDATPSAYPHGVSVEDFEKKTAPRNILGNILTRAAQPWTPTAPAASTSALSTAALDRAIREYDENEDLETEGEDGEHSD
ncbi:hypothetical protein DFH06DRAFT_1145686 [Mycena polygramma]|nr:hypothetical protein DFH06DRAFT_1145686 [Mycena polygramma]